MKDFNSILSSKVRMVCFAILLLNGSLHVTIKNKGFIVTWVIIAPFIFEAFSAGLFGTFIF